MAKTPDFLVIGHVAKDMDPTGGGFQAGGTAAYSALTGARLGLRVAMMTSFGPGFRLPPLLRDVEVSVAPSRVTTTLYNTYSREGRRQRVGPVAGRIEARHIPASWRRSPLVHLGPIAQEIDPEVSGLFPDALVCVSPQGWMRRWDEDGQVQMAAWEHSELVLPHVQLLVLSEEDLAARPDAVLTYAEAVPVTVVTQGKRGARVHAGGRWVPVPAIPAEEVDPTGVGDVYAAAFAIRYSETRDPLDAAVFAAGAASFAVEGSGIGVVPTREQVEARLSHYDIDIRRRMGGWLDT
ncbi:MAG: PfkB family carbohydrate kinase [Dehalococcoidia bacterium]